MAPKLRTRNERRAKRLRRWAAPFVLTFAMAPAAGCTKASDKDTTKETVKDPVTAAQGNANEAADPNANRNPDTTVKDPDTTNEPVKEPVKEPDTTNDPDTTAKPPPVRVAYGHIEKMPKGHCEWVWRADCAPGEKCNPPPPQKVKCPDRLPEGHQVSQRGDECWMQVPPNCPAPKPGQPMRTCNPPAPTKIDCPE